MIRSKPVRILGIVTTVLLVLILAVKILLPAEKIRDLALQQARERLGRDVSVGDVSLSLRGGLGVRLADFAIANPTGFPGEPLAVIQGVDLKLAIGPLLKGEMRVGRLVLDAPRLNLVTLADGSNNFTFAEAEQAAPGAAGTAGKESQAAISVDQFSLRAGHLTFASAQGQEMQAVFTGLQGALTLQDPEPGQYVIQGDLKAEQMTFSSLVPAPDLPAEVSYELVWDNKAKLLDIKNLQGTLAGFPLSCQGNVQVADAGPTTRLQGQVRDIDLGKLWTLFKPLLPPEQKGELAGRGDLDLNLAVGPGGIDQLTYSGTAVFRKASYTQTQLVDELQSMDAELNFTEKQFTVTRSDLAFNAGRFQLTGSLRDPFPYFLPPEMRAGRAVPRPHLEFTLRSPRLDVDRLIPAASPSGAAAGGSKTPSGKTAATLDLEFPDLTASGTFQADSLIYMQVPFTGVTGQVDIQDRVVACREVKGAVYGGRVEGQVNVDLKNLNDPAYGGTYQARDIEVDNFMQRFVGLAGVVFGGASMSGQFSAHGRDPDVIRNSLNLASDAQILKGRLVTKGQLHGTLAQLASQTGNNLAGEQALRDLATRIKVDQGRVGLDNLSMKLGQWGDLKFAGYYSFTGKLDYTGNLLLTAEQTDRLFSRGILAELAKLLGDQRPARLELPLTVGGNRTDPEIKLDLGTVTSDLQQKALDEQKNKLESEAKDQLNDKLDDLLKKWK